MRCAPHCGRSAADLIISRGETSLDTREVIALEEQFGAHNYRPLPIVISKAERIWVYDPEGRRYMDMLSAYSAVNQGHRHPRIIQALKDQADRVTLTSRAFYNDKLGMFYRKLTDITKKDMALPMNSGAEAVETAIKAVRRHAYHVRGIPADKAEIVVCHNNFHGRTLAAISMSTNTEYRDGFGPLAPGFAAVPFGDLDALRAAINDRTAAFFIEPIQGEAGVILPPPGYLRAARDLCREHGVLFVADEIQSGFGRAGKMFACEWEDVVPDVYILGKALGGGVMPISAVAADQDILGLFEPGSHGSTFGGNPLAAACAIAALDVTVEEKLPDRSRALGEYFLAELRAMHIAHARDVRGRGLWIGLELDRPARPFCEQLKQAGILCKETHERVIRFAPPLVIEQEELDIALSAIRQVLART